MKRISVFCLLFLVGLAVYGAPKLEFRPKFYGSTLYNFLWDKDDGIGFNLVGLDCSLLKYKNFYFLDFGAGAVLLRGDKSGWIDLYAGSQYLDTVYATWKDWYLTYYVKFIPVKVPLKNIFFLDLGIAYTGKHHWALIFGLSIKLGGK